jgi:hypothetical protein
MATSFRGLLNSVVTHGLNGDLTSLQKSINSVPIGLRRTIAESATCILFNKKGETLNFVPVLHLLCDSCKTLQLEVHENKKTNFFVLKKIKKIE